MTFQSHLDNIREKIGKNPQDFVRPAEKRGILQPGVKTTEIVQWLKQDLGPGHGHAMAIVSVPKHAKPPMPRVDERIDKLFRGDRTVRTPASAEAVRANVLEDLGTMLPGSIAVNLNIRRPVPSDEERRLGLFPGSGSNPHADRSGSRRECR